MSDELIEGRELAQALRHQRQAAAFWREGLQELAALSYARSRLWVRRHYVRKAFAPFLPY